MIELTHGDLFEADVEALVNTVNCVGFMGRGIAEQFKRAFPRNFEIYAAACKCGDVVPGKMLVVETGEITHPRYIINFPTKRHWRGKSRLSDIAAGLDALVVDVERLKIRSIAIPPLGCGLGGLPWSQVKPLIEEAFTRLPEVRAVVYEPKGAPATQRIQRAKNVPKMTPGRAVLVGLMERYLAGLMDPFVSLLEVHKLMYFAQEAGESLKLRYVPGPFGPYAENLRHVLSAIEGHLVRGFGDGGDAPEKQLDLLPGATDQAAAVLADQPATRATFDRVADLVEGFETPFGMELLATVHWVAARQKASTREQVTEAVYNWDERKRRFSPRQIGIALDVLIEKAWLPGRV